MKKYESPSEQWASSSSYMACCAVAGQGSGVAAALSLRTGRDLDRVDVGQVQSVLERQAVRVR